MEKAKYNGNALDILKSKRFMSVLAGVMVAGLVSLVPDLEPHREQLYGLIALVFGGLAAGYNIEDWIEAAMRVISGDPLPDAPEDIWGDIEEKNEDNPPVTLPDLEQRIGQQLNPHADLRNAEFRELNYPDETETPENRTIAVPKGYGYVAATGDTKAHTDAFYDEGEGFKMMLDNRGAMEIGSRAYFGYESLDLIHVQQGAVYSLSPHFDAKISGGAINIKADIIYNSEVVSDFTPHRIPDGEHDNQSVVWAWQPDKTMDIRFRVYAETEYATLTNDSFIRWREFPFVVQPADYGTLKKTAV